MLKAKRQTVVADAWRLSWESLTVLIFRCLHHPVLATSNPPKVHAARASAYRWPMVNFVRSSITTGHPRPPGCMICRYRRHYRVRLFVLRIHFYPIQNYIIMKYAAVIVKASLRSWEDMFVCTTAHGQGEKTESPTNVAPVSEKAAMASASWSYVCRRPYRETLPFISSLWLLVKINFLYLLFVCLSNKSRNFTKSRPSVNGKYY